MAKCKALTGSAVKGLKSEVASLTFLSQIRPGFSSTEVDILTYTYDTMSCSCLWAVMLRAFSCNESSRAVIIKKSRLINYSGNCHVDLCTPVERCSHLSVVVLLPPLLSWLLFISEAACEVNEKVIKCTKISVSRYNLVLASIDELYVYFLMLCVHCLSLQCSVVRTFGHAI